LVRLAVDLDPPIETAILFLAVDDRVAEPNANGDRRPAFHQKSFV